MFDIWHRARDIVHTNITEHDINRQRWWQNTLILWKICMISWIILK